MKNVVGIDLGGTTVEGGKIEDGRIVSRYSADTQASSGGDVTLDNIKKVIRHLIDADTAAIGIGVPSVVDREKGIVYNVQNIAGWEEVHLKYLLETEFGLPVHIDNDANCFAYGEKIYGNGRFYPNYVGVTLGTGVGAGIIQNGKLLCDANCGSGEFCEIPFKDSKLEDYCASRFFTDYAGLSGRELSEKARQGDEAAIECFQEYGRNLSYLVRIIILVLDPQAIIFGGSIAQSFDLFKDAIISNLSDFPYPNSIKHLEILAANQSDSGVLGAASLCF